MDLASYQHLKLERLPGGVMLVTLNRPDVLNAAHEAMHSELATIWADLNRDDETRVAVVTGAGRAFSAGGDLGMVERQIGNYDLVTSMLREMSDLVYNMANCEKPIVSAINGVAVGAGLVVALLADISICDLTAMWAGPLATWLLARLGAKVYKVEPAVRLDGTRALFGGGIYPGGIQRRPGEDSALYQALNHGKTRVPLDLP